MHYGGTSKSNFASAESTQFIDLKLFHCDELLGVVFTPII